MKALALAGAIGLATVGLARADFLDTSFGLDGPGYDGTQTGSAYYVAKPGDPITLEQPHYWGGPSWRLCGGIDPPYQSYPIPPASCRSVLLRRHHHRHAQAHLK